MNDKILNECRQAKERIAALFSDVDTLMDFLMKRREQRLKQGKKYVDFSPYRQKNKATVNLNPASACGSTMPWSPVVRMRGFQF